MLESGSSVGDPDGLAGWDRIIAINQTSVFLGTKLAAEQMAITGGGSIVNISSIMGFVGSASGQPGISCLEGCGPDRSKAAAARYGPSGVRVNTVHPGYMPPMLNATNAGERDDKIADSVAADRPADRSGLWSAVSGVRRGLVCDRGRVGGRRRLYRAMTAGLALMINIELDGLRQVVASTGKASDKDISAAELYINRQIEDPLDFGDNIALSRLDDRIEVLQEERSCYELVLAMLVAAAKAGEKVETAELLAEIDELRDDFDRKIDVARSEMRRLAGSAIVGTLNLDVRSGAAAQRHHRQIIGDGIIAFCGPPFTGVNEHGGLACAAALDQLANLAPSSPNCPT